MDNPLLNMNRPIHFPIIAAMNAYLQPGEEFRVIEVTGSDEVSVENTRILSAEIEEVCRERGCRLSGGLERVPAPKNQSVSENLALFQRLIEKVDDDDELFACITFGTKPMSMSLLTAVRYAYRLKKNTTISCVVYGEPIRVRDADGKLHTEGANIYDETAMVQLDEITVALANRGVSNPKAFIDILFQL